MPDLACLLAELGERNRDNVSRTESYLQLYAYTIENPPDFPWLLMAHLVSRNAGYLMTDVARARQRMGAEAADELFLFLERANYLIFHDAWEHVLRHLLGMAHARRTPRFMTEAWARHRRAPEERRLVLDLVHNEQHYIENRVVRNPRFARALATVGMIEAAGREKPIVLPLSDEEIRVGGFADVGRRIDTGRRIFDSVLAPGERRRAIFEWARAHPHTGDRAVAAGRPGPGLREVWPVERVRAMDARIHAEPEEDAEYP